MTDNERRLRVCKAWIERAAALGYKPGKKRDAACLEFIQGARVALDDTPPFTEQRPTCLDGLVFMVALRGEFEVRRYLQNHTPPVES